MEKKGNSGSELEILERIDALLRKEDIRIAIDEICNGIADQLKKKKKEVLVWRSLPLSIFGGELPIQIRSSWVFGIQAKCETGAERHPHSHQRMMSYRGSGNLQVWDGKRWISRFLVSDREEKIGKRWISIPPKTWHQVVTGDSIWLVVSFHTVGDMELIEERPDPDDPVVIQKRSYLS